MTISGTNFTIAHDDMGNVTSSVGLQHEYDHAGRLVRTTDAFGNLVEAYSYDALGNLVVTEDATGNARVLHWDGDRLLAATDLASGAPLWDAVFSPTHQDKLLEFYDHQTDTTHVPITDHRNNVVGAWNATTGTMGGLARYDAEGLITQLSPAEQTLCDERTSATTLCETPGGIPFGFNSLFRSPATGMVYMRNRWYSPRLGQFMSHDPLEYVDTSNLYAFAAFDPVNKWDPFGLGETDHANSNKKKPNSTVEEESSSRFTTLTPEEESLVNDAMEALSDAPTEALTKTWLVVEASHPVQDQKWTERQRKKFKYISKDAVIECGLLCKATFAGEAVQGALDTAGLANLPRLLVKGGISLGKHGVRGWTKRSARLVCSFPEDTPVLMCDGSLRAIQDVQEGDLVLSQDPTTGEMGCQQVVDPYANPMRALIAVELVGEEGTERLEVTDNHPFWVVGRGWTRTDELSPGDEIASADGGTLAVGSLAWTGTRTVVFNFGVEGFHTYFVGESGAWVHNCFKKLARYVGTEPGSTSRQFAGCGSRIYQRLTA